MHAAGSAPASQFAHQMQSRPPGELSQPHVMPQPRSNALVLVLIALLVAAVAALVVLVI
jgi:hypothetical protein